MFFHNKARFCSVVVAVFPLPPQPAPFRYLSGFSAAPHLCRNMADLDRAGIERLSDSNHSKWARQMRFLLASRELSAAITEADHPKSAVVKGILGLAVSEKYQDLVDTANSAKAAWDALEAKFAAKNNARLLDLLREFSNLQMASGESTDDYVSRAKSLSSALEAAGEKVSDRQIVAQVLNGLGREFNNLVDILTEKAEQPTLEKVQDSLRQHENRRLKQDRSSSGATTSGRGKAFTAAGSSRPATPPPRKPSSSRTKLVKRCNYCHKLGHLAAECRKRLADEEQTRVPGPSFRPGVARGGKQVGLAASSTSDGSEVGSGWILDSGATAHMTGNKALLKNFCALDAGPSITAAFGNSALVTGKGDAEISTAEYPAGIMLRNVLYVPEMSFNLLSVPTVVQRGAIVEYSADECRILIGSKTVAKAARQPDGLFALPARNTAMLVRPTETAELWHKRFGHLAYSSLAKLVAADMVKGVHVPAQDFAALSKEICEPCILAKHSREPFGDSDSKSTRSLQLVHMDVCGPLPVESLGGSRYFATYLDDFSKLSVVQPVASKAEVASITKEVLAQLERISGHKVGTVRTDRGGEYLSKDLEDHFSKLGVRHQLTMRYTPQQNGVAERLNRTLLEKVRAMLEDSQISKRLWAEALVTANHVRNRSPAAGASKTPWELFHGIKPDVSGLRAFGSVAYAHIPSQLRQKLDSRSVKGVMVGYGIRSKGYRILLPSGDVVESRDVVFAESAPSIVQLDIPTNGSKPAEQQEQQVDDDESVGAEAPVEGTSLLESAPSSQHEQEQIGDTPAVEVRRSTRPRKPSFKAAQAEAEQATRQRRAAAPTANTAILSLTAMPQELVADRMDAVEPTTFAEAMHSKHAAQWRAAMDEEMASLHTNNTWELEDLPAGAKAIPVKWVFKVKRTPTGAIERYKARLVAKGFLQREGVDFDEAFAPVSKHSTLRALLAKAAAEDLELHALDIKTAFLNGELEEDVYIQQPPGYVEGTKVAHLRKALYGLRQAPRAWHLRLKQELEGMGFTASAADPSLFVGQHQDGRVYLLTYVDDLLVAARSKAAVSFVKERIKTAFDTRDLGEVSTFLGMSITRDRSKQQLKLSQEGMVTKLVDRFGLSKAQPKSTPLSVSTQLTKDSGQPLDSTAQPYSTLVGSLLYLAACTRPDIAQAVGALAKYMSAPRSSHWEAAKGVLRYLKGTSTLGITFSSSGSKELVGYSDADYAGDRDTRRSTTGYVFMQHGGAISWSSRRQVTVAASTTEAEYMAEAAAAKEATWLRTLLADLDYRTSTVRVFGDNQSAIKLAESAVTSARSKHIDVLYHFVRERVARGDIVLRYVPTAYMVADSLTKAVPEEKAIWCRQQMGLK